MFNYLELHINKIHVWRRLIIQYSTLAVSYKTSYLFSIDCWNLLLVICKMHNRAKLRTSRCAKSRVGADFIADHWDIC